MLWLHCDVTGMMGNPLSFPGRPESSDVTCSVDLLSPFMVHADSLYGLEFGAIPLHGFNFVLMIRILQCNVIMFHMWWLYIYKWLLMCADISSDILCSRQKKHIQTSSHQFNMCSSIIRWRRVWRVAQGDRDPALQGVLAVKNSGDLFGGKLMEIVGNPVYLWRFWGIFWPICLVIRISVASSTVI